MKCLTEQNLSLHKEYLRELKLRLAVLEKSFPSGNTETLKDVRRLPLNSEEREAWRRLKAEVLAHEIYFSSFGKSGTPSESVREKYGSEASFLYTLYEECMKAKGGFLFIWKSNRGVEFFVTDEYSDLLERYTPILALDLCEHAYFNDYLYDKKAYIQASLRELDLSKL